MGALTDEILNSIPWWSRLLPCCYNRTVESRVRCSLLRRSRPDVRAAWEAYSAFRPNAARAVTRAVEASFRWPAERLIPRDQCCIVFRTWERGWGDDMSLEVFLMRIEVLFPSVDESLLEREWKKICGGTLHDFVTLLCGR